MDTWKTLFILKHYTTLYQNFPPRLKFYEQHVFSSKQTDTLNYSVSLIIIFFIAEQLYSAYFLLTEKLIVFKKNTYLGT